MKNRFGISYYRNTIHKIYRGTRYRSKISAAKRDVLSSLILGDNPYIIENSQIPKSKNPKPPKK